MQSTEGDLELVADLSRLAVNDSGDSLELGTELKRWWVFAPSMFALRRMRPATPARVSAARRVVCERDQLVIEHQVFAAEPRRIRRIPRSDIERLRVLMVGRQEGGIVVELRVSVSTGAAVTPVRFRVAGLDVESEVVAFALQVARALGLSRYRVLSVTPPDIELLVQAQDEASPYRAVGFTQLVPEQAAVVDYAAAYENEFVEPSEPVAPFEAAGAPVSPWQLDEWAPGTRVASRRSGWSRRANNLLLALFYVPLSAAAVFAAVAVGTGVVAAVPMTALLIATFVFEMLDISPKEFLAFGSLLCLVGGFIYTAVWSIRGVYAWARDGYRDRLEHACELDWSSHDLVRRRGRREVERVPLEDIDAVSVTRGRGFGRICARVRRRDIELVFWHGEQSRAAATEAGVELARALGVPVHL